MEKARASSARVSRPQRAVGRGVIAGEAVDQNDRIALALFDVVNIELAAGHARH